jgi:soluble lytic murein transglycosylase-like protein
MRPDRGPVKTARAAAGASSRWSRRSQALLRMLAFAICVPMLAPPSWASSDQPPLQLRAVDTRQVDKQQGDTRQGDTRQGYRAIIEQEAKVAGLPPEIAEAVMGVESGYNPDVIGADGEIGLMQVLPSTARMMGFTGSLAELARPEINIRYGVSYLAAAWNRAGKDLCTAVMKYRAGHGETRFSYLSVNYCLRVRANLAARGYPVTGAVPVATFGSVAGAVAVSCRGRCVGRPTAGRIDLAGLNSRLSQLVVQVSAQRAAMR